MHGRHRSIDGGDQHQFETRATTRKEDACNAAKRLIKRLDPFALKRSASEVNTRGAPTRGDDDLCSADATSQARRRP